MLDEIFLTSRKFFEFWLKAADPRTYLKDVTQEELMEFGSKLMNYSLNFWQISSEYMAKMYSALIRGDAEEILNVQLEYLSKLEDAVAELANTAVYSAYVNAINRAYMNQLILMQEFSNALFHSLGIPTRKDIVALSEAYVDLKGDIKREMREIKGELAEMKKLISGGDK